jgi:hypothetical protein
MKVRLIVFLLDIFLCHVCDSTHLKYLLQHHDGMCLDIFYCFVVQFPTFGLLCNFIEKVPDGRWNILHWCFHYRVIAIFWRRKQHKDEWSAGKKCAVSLGTLYHNTQIFRRHCKMPISWICSYNEIRNACFVVLVCTMSKAWWLKGMWLTDDWCRQYTAA